MGGQSSKSKKNKQDDAESDEDDDEEVLEIDETIESTDWSGFPSDCEKNPGHKNFVPIWSLNLKDLPVELRIQAVLNYILACSKVVVKIVVRKKTDSMTLFKATGYAWCTENKLSKLCHLENCKDTIQHCLYGDFVVYTNQHVINNEDEAKNALVKFFYDHSNKPEDVVEAYGCGAREILNNKDLVGLIVRVHQEDFYDRVSAYHADISQAWAKIPLRFKEKLKHHAIVISHPHGNTKQVTFGKLLTLEEEEIQIPKNNQGATKKNDQGATKKNDQGDPCTERSRPEHRKLTQYSASTCSGSSGAPVLTGYYPHRPFTHSCSLKNRDVNFSVSY